MRPIDADALEELFRKVIAGIAKRGEVAGALEHLVRASAMTIKMIWDAPTVEPEERKAEWGTLPYNAYPFVCVCTACHEKHDGHTRYCPNCGARMEGIP